MTDTADSPPANGSFASQATRWLFHQGVSTVLLIGILWAVYKKGPAAYDRVADQLAAKDVACHEERKETQGAFLDALEKRDAAEERRMDRFQGRKNAGIEADDPDHRMVATPGGDS